MPPKALFKGQVFALSGKLSQPQKDYEELIHKHGGVVASSLTTVVTFLVSTEDDVKSCSQKVATAQGRGIPIVQEGFVGACIAAKKLLGSEFFAIKAAGKKRKSSASASAPAKASRVAAPPPAADASSVARHSASTPVTIAEGVSVIAKSGLSEVAGVVQEDVSKGFVKGSLTWDVELVLADPATGKDKYYIMQLLATKDRSLPAEFWAVQHWGKTGLDGRANVDGPFTDIVAAKRIFRKKYRQKTGNVWGQLGSSFIDAPGKYKLLSKDATSEAKGTWQYYVHATVDGKKVSWYDYDAAAAENMEKYWRQFKTNEGLGVRVIQTDYFKYEIDFREMIQKNTTSGTRRAIRRVAAGEKASSGPPAKIPEAVAPGPAVAPAAESSDEEMDEDDDEDEEGDKDASEADEDEAAASAASEGAEDHGSCAAASASRGAVAAAPAAREAAAQWASAEAETLVMDDSLTAETLPMRGH